MCLSIAVRTLAEVSPGLVWAPVEACLAWLLRLHVWLTLLICVDIWLVWVALLPL